MESYTDGLVDMAPPGAVVVRESTDNRAVKSDSPSALPCVAMVVIQPLCTSDPVSDWFPEGLDMRLGKGRAPHCLILFPLL